MGTKLTKEIIKCHYDTHPYRDAFHKRNSPCHLLFCSFIIFLLLTIVSTILLSTIPSNQAGASYDFTEELIRLSRLNRSVILRDLQQIYPDDLELSISPHRITANQHYPLCFPAPKFLLPFLTSTNSDDTLSDDEHAASSDIDDIKRRAHDSVQDDIFKYTRNWLHPSSMLSQDEQMKAMQDEEDWATVSVEEVWEALIGYALDPDCFVRIDASSSTLMDQLSAANVDPTTHQQIICSSHVEYVMKPSFLVINPDNGVVYQLTVDMMYQMSNGCKTFQNTLSFDAMDKAKFEELLSERNPTVAEFFDLMNKYLFWVVLVVLLLIVLIYFAWMAFLFACMILEAVVATIVVWLIVFVLRSFGAFQEFGNKSPTCKQIWSMNVLLCVPDFSFIRIVELSNMSVYWRVGARVFITLLLIVDVYQHDPPPQILGNQPRDD